MTDTLFDPEHYGAGKAIRTKHAVEPLSVRNDGQWHLVVRKGKEPHPFAHRLDFKVMTVYDREGKAHLTAWDGKSRWEGGWRAKCGVLGGVLDLPEGAVNACPKCKDRA